jgi:phage baseplate assembly protein W
MPYKNIVITPPKNLSLDTKKESQFYRGFSTVYSSGNSKLYDEELVKQDLLNHFNTRKGERLMNPEFGTIIWDALYDPLTDGLREEIEADIREILASEPRIVPIAVEVTEQDYGILLEITVTYNKTNQTENMRISFDRDAGLITQ